MLTNRIFPFSKPQKTGEPFCIFGICSYNKDNFLEHIDPFRFIASQKIDEGRKSEFSQYFTPAEIARFMASLFQNFDKDVSLLEPGARIGSLSAAFVEKVMNEKADLDSFNVTCYEKDKHLLISLEKTLDVCKNHVLNKKLVIPLLNLP